MNDGSKHVTVINRMFTDVKEEEVPEKADQHGTRQMRFRRRKTTKTNQLVFRNMVQDLDIDLNFVNDGEAAVTAF
jgi:hypothetical protein